MGVPVEEYADEGVAVEGVADEGVADEGDVVVEYAVEGAAGISNMPPDAIAIDARVSPDV